MYRVKSIETVFGYASLYKSSCSVIQINNHAGHYSTYPPIVHHENKCAKKLHTSTIWERVTIYIKKIKYNDNNNPSPFIIHSKPGSESGHVQRNPSTILRCRRFSRTISVATPNASVNITLCVPSAPFGSVSESVSEASLPQK